MGVLSLKHLMHKDSCTNRRSRDVDTYTAHSIRYTTVHEIAVLSTQLFRTLYPFFLKPGKDVLFDVNSPVEYEIEREATSAC